MKTVLVILGIWLLASIPAGLLVGFIIRAGRGLEQ